MLRHCLVTPIIVQAGIIAGLFVVPPHAEAFSFLLPNYRLEQVTHEKRNALVPSINNLGEIVYLTGPFLISTHRGVIAQDASELDISDAGEIVYQVQQGGGRLFSTLRGQALPAPLEGIANPRINNRGEILFQYVTVVEKQVLFLGILNDGGLATIPTPSGLASNPDFNDRGEVVFTLIDHFPDPRLTEVFSTVRGQLTDLPVPGAEYPRINNRGDVLVTRAGIFDDLFLVGVGQVIEGRVTGYDINDHGVIVFGAQEGPETGALFQIFRATPIPQPPGYVLVLLGFLAFCVLARAKGLRVRLKGLPPTYLATIPRSMQPPSNPLAP